jgi:hypothetical protein
LAATIGFEWGRETHPAWVSLIIYFKKNMGNIWNIYSSKYFKLDLIKYLYIWWWIFQIRMRGRDRMKIKEVLEV